MFEKSDGINRNNVQTIKRNIFALINIGDEGGNLVCDICMDLKRGDKLKKNIIANTKKLRQTLGAFDIPHGEIKITNIYDNKENLSKNLTINIDTRAIIFYINNIFENITITNENSYFSHFIEIKVNFDDKSSGWKGTDSFSSVRIDICNTDEVFYIIEDMMLDIQMFYYFNHDKFFTTVDDRQNFSTKKSNYASIEKLHSLFGKIENDAKYFSFASACRSDETKTIDFEQYVGIWNSFNVWLKNVHINANNTYNKDNTDMKLAAFLKHPEYYQISKKKLLNIVNGLEDGEYILIRTRRKPKLSRIRKEVLSIFSVKKWRNGLLKVCLYKNKYALLRYLPYISMFYFNIKKEEEVVDE